MLGLGSGLSGGALTLTLAQEAADAYKTRVIADGGVFESRTCLEAQLTILSNIE